MSYSSTALGDTYDRRPPANPGQYPGCITAAQRAAAHAACKPSTLRGLGLLDVASANPCWVETLPLCPPFASPPAAPAVDWVALAKYAAAVKAADDKRAADLVAYATAVKAAKDRADLLAYAAAVKAANDKKAADLAAYAAAVKAHQTLPPTMRAATPRPAPPPPAAPPPTKPPVMRTAPQPGTPSPPVQAAPPAPPPGTPPEILSALPTEYDTPPPAHGGFGTGGMLAVLAVAAVGGWFIFRKKKPAA